MLTTKQHSPEAVSLCVDGLTSGDDGHGHGYVKWGYTSDIGEGE